ncbi:hypothetical protein D3C81_1502140 [compost metagenome]
MTQGAVGGVLQADFRLVDVEHELLQVAHAVLHGQRHLDDVLVLGEHLPLLGVGTLAGDVLLELLVDRREIEVQAGANRFVELAEAQDHCLLLLIDHVDGVVQPQHGEHGQADAEDAQAAALAAGAEAPTAALLAEDTVQAVLQFAERLVQVRRPLTTATTATAPGVLVVLVVTRLIPGHSALHLNNAKTRLRRAHQCYRMPGPLPKTAPRALLQSVLRNEFRRLPTFTAHQAIQLDSRQANLQ